MSDKDANQLIDEAAKEPSLDELFARNPKTLAPADREAMVTMLRQQRVLWEKKQDKKAAKKEGVEPTAETTAEE